MTHENLAIVFDSILSSRRKRSTRVAYLFVDLKKAFDSVNRQKLYEILLKRCKNNNDRQIVVLLMDLFMNNVVKYDDHTFDVERGVFQGSIFSPFLFNVYLEEALMSKPYLK